MLWGMAFVRWVTGVTAMMVLFIAGGSAVVLLAGSEIFPAIVAGLLAWGAYEVMMRSHRD
jgi:hypothetical protein